MDEGREGDKQVVVGRVRAPRGIRGEIKVEVLSDFPGRFSAGEVLFVGEKPFRIQRSLALKGDRVLKLEGVDTREAAEKLRGLALTVPPEALPPLPEGQYYHYQIMDMEVYTQEGERLGKVVEILTTGSNDVYVVRQGKEEVLVPALEEVIQEVDPQRGVMVVALPQGLR